MEVAMTRTAVRHTIFALATLALLTVFTSLTAYAQSRSPFMGIKPPQNSRPNTFILTDIESGFDTR
jgi:hypothetical protein